MSWTDLDAADLAKVSFPKKTDLGLRLVREPGPAKIIVEAIPSKAKKVVYLRVPEEFHARLEACVAGSKNAAVQAIVEEALDLLEQGNQCWRVIARTSTCE